MSEPVSKAEVPFLNRVSTFDFHDAEIVHDRVLLVEDKKFYVQSGYLAVWSEFFNTLFNAEFKEKNETEIKLEDVSANEFKVFLQLTYPVFFEVKAKHLESLITLSHRFVAPHVLEICMKFIDKEFDQIDKIMLYKVADMHEMESLKEKAMTFITKNVESLSLIQLLKLAFDHDLSDLKADLRSLIYTADREVRWYKCIKCAFRIQRNTCTHGDHLSKPLTRNSVIANLIEEIVKLPTEIQHFVLRASVDYK